MIFAKLTYCGGDAIYNLRLASYMYALVSDAWYTFAMDAVLKLCSGIVGGYGLHRMCLHCIHWAMLDQYVYGTRDTTKCPCTNAIRILGEIGIFHS